MNRAPRPWPRGLTSPPAPPRAARAWPHVFVAFLLRRCLRAALVRETHGRAAGRARYRDGDEGRSQSLGCKASGRRTPLVHCDCKHSASPLDVCDFDAEAAAGLPPLVRDDYGARTEADVGQGAARADDLPRAPPPLVVGYQLDPAPPFVRAVRAGREQRELHGLRLLV